MSAIRYETAADRGREAAFAHVLEQSWKCTLVKLPDRFSLDYAAQRNGEIVSFIEIKCRNTNSWTYDSTMIDWYKWMAAWELTQSTRKPCILAVRFQDCAMYYPKLGIGEGVSYKIGGRNDRGNPQDKSIEAYIPMRFLVPIRACAR